MPAKPVPRHLTVPNLRPMLPADVDVATELILANDWGVRREWLQFATTQPACVPMVAEADGSIIGTGVGTANGAVGWIGTIFLEPAWRGQGLGRALTEAIIDRLESAGCRTLVLVATSQGRRLYERMGFEVQSRYRIMQAIGLPPVVGPAEDGVRAYTPDDLDAVLRLDADGTGEARGHAIHRFATPETARVAPASDGGLDGFVIRAPWGGGATVARTPEAAVRILTARRRAAGLEGRVRVGVLDDNAEGIGRMLEVGLRHAWSAPRMVRGEALRWHPDWIWGQFNHAMG